MERLMMFANQEYGGSSTILNGFLQRKLNCPLHEIKISRRAQVEYTGKGRLYTDGKGLVIDVVGDHQSGDGVDIPSGQLLTLGDKWEFEADSFDKTTKIGGFGRVTKQINHCRIDVEHLVATDFSPRPTHRLFAILRPTNGDIQFNRKSVISDDNPVFKGNGAKKTDWLQVDHLNVLYSLRIFDNGQLRLQIDAAEPCDLKALLKAFLGSLSLLLGEDVEAFASTIYGPSGASTSIIPSRQQPHSLPSYPLIVHDNKTIESFLKLCLDFFLRHESGSVPLLFLRMIWDSHKSHVEVRELAASTAVEGIAKQYIIERFLWEVQSEAAQSNKAEQSKFNKYRKKAKLLLENCEPLAEPSKFFEAMKLWVSSAQLVTAVDSVLAAGRIVDVDLPLDLVERWRKMRNPAAHGSLPLTDFGQERLDNFYAALTLCHMLVLGLLKYRGEFIDYSTLDWPSRDFPKCDSNLSNPTIADGGSEQSSEAAKSLQS